MFACFGAKFGAGGGNAGACFGAGGGCIGSGCREVTNGRTPTGHHGATGATKKKPRHWCHQTRKVEQQVCYYWQAAAAYCAIFATNKTYKTIHYWLAQQTNQMMC